MSEEASFAAPAGQPEPVANGRQGGGKPLSGYRVIEVDINQRVVEALADSPLSAKDKQRCKNFYTLGLMYWVYSRPLEPTIQWLDDKFKDKPELAEANKKALRAGYNFNADELNFSAGAGLFATVGQVAGTLDYAYTDGGFLGAINRLSLGLRF